MKLKTFNPITPSLRHQILIKYNLKKNLKKKSLITNLNRSFGRNHSGKITCRHKERGHKKLYRKIDFKRNILDLSGVVLNIQYDPFRNVPIALIKYTPTLFKYILYIKDLKEGDTIISSYNNQENKLGYCLPLKFIKLGTEIHNIEITPKSGGKLVRAAGTSAILLAKENSYCAIRLPSKEIRLIHQNCRATIGKLGNELVKNIKLGKAGRNRWLGIRPTVRGSAMNPVDHPHGGGEGRSPIGRKHPFTPWGKPALGIKTRNPRKNSTKFIIKKA